MTLKVGDRVILNSVECANHLRIGTAIKVFPHSPPMVTVSFDEPTKPGLKEVMYSARELQLVTTVKDYPDDPVLIPVDFFT